MSIIFDDTLRKIHIQIGGFRFPLRIEKSDEEIYRKAEKQANLFIEEYQQLYQGKSAEEILSLVCLRLAVVVFRVMSDKDVEPISDKILEWDEELKKLFSDDLPK